MYVITEMWNVRHTHGTVESVVFLVKHVNQLGQYNSQNKVQNSNEYNTDHSQQAEYTLCLRKTALMLHTITSSHINRF